MIQNNLSGFGKWLCILPKEIEFSKPYLHRNIHRHRHRQRERARCLVDDPFWLVTVFAFLQESQNPSLLSSTIHSCHACCSCLRALFHILHLGIYSSYPQQRHWMDNPGWPNVPFFFSTTLASNSPLIRFTWSRVDTDPANFSVVLTNQVSISHETFFVFLMSFLGWSV